MNLLALVLLAGMAHGAEQGIVEDFTEQKTNSLSDPYLDGLNKSRSKHEAEMLQNVDLIQSAHGTYKKFNDRVRVPGFISAAKLPQLGRIVGPVLPADTSLRLGDTVFIRWYGAVPPKVGDRYASFTPGIVLQNTENLTDFEVFDVPTSSIKIPKYRRLAGYIYETNGRIKVMKVSGHVVTAVVEQLSSRAGIGNEIMEIPPLLNAVPPVTNGNRVSAAVVCGSPTDRLSTTERSFVYLNRGSRDGIQVGRVFESIENVKTDQPMDEKVEMSNGEAIIVHVTESFSTAMITKQFDVIRIGSLLSSKTGANGIIQSRPYNGYSADPRVDNPNYKGSVEDVSGNGTAGNGAEEKGNTSTTSDQNGPETKKMGSEIPEVPDLENLPVASDESLPVPHKRPSGPALSDLDELEKNLNFQDLSPDERTKLNKLSTQEKIEAAQQSSGELSDNPGAPTIDNSFGDQGSSTKKKPKKKASAKNDEEELNLLMMQN
jgi:hypothetical protein